MSPLPTPLRAALGVALTTVDVARETAAGLPSMVVGLPVAVVSQAVQISLRAQQQYAAFVSKGDELIGAFHGTPEEAPSWATFDETVPSGETPSRNTAFDRVGDLAEEGVDDLTDDLGGGAAAALADDLDGLVDLTSGAADVGDDDEVVEEIISYEGHATTPREPGTSASPPAAKAAGPAKRPAAPAPMDEPPGPRKSAKVAAPTKRARKAAPDRSTTLEGDPLPETGVAAGAAVTDPTAPVDALAADPLSDLVADEAAAELEAEIVAELATEQLIAPTAGEAADAVDDADAETIAEIATELESVEESLGEPPTD